MLVKNSSRDFLFYSIIFSKLTITLTRNLADQSSFRLITQSIVSSICQPTQNAPRLARVITITLPCTGRSNYRTDPGDDTCVRDQHRDRSCPAGDSVSSDTEHWTEFHKTRQCRVYRVWKKARSLTKWYVTFHSLFDTQQLLTYYQAERKLTKTYLSLTTRMFLMAILHFKFQCFSAHHKAHNTDLKA